MNRPLTALTCGTATALVLTALPLAAHADPARLGVPDREIVTPITGDPGLGDDVEASYVRLHYPSPHSTMAHPESCDWIGYVRYHSKRGPADTADTDAVLTVQPGTYSGAANLNIQGPQVVRKAAEKGKHVEYVALQRRSNCAEDRTGWEAAHRADDYHVAADYYFHGKEIDGHTYHYQTPQDLAYLGEYGLTLTLDDWRAVIEHLLPDPARRTKSFCGGHSLGAFLTGPMMGWNFAGDPNAADYAGFNLCGGGLIPEDGFAMTDPIGLSGTGVIDQVMSAAGGVLKKGVNLLMTNGLGVAQLPVIAASEVMNTYYLAAMAADQRPDAESDIKSIVPRELRTEPWMRLFYGKDYLDLFTGANVPDDFRVTNTAHLGMFFDQNSAEYVLQAGMGFYDCPVEGKTYPLPNGLASVPILGPTLFVVPLRVGYGQNYTPANHQQLCGWRNYDGVAPSSIDGPILGRGPATDQDHEVTDIRQFAHAMNPGWQPTGYFEEYTPLRLITDTVFAMGIGRDGDLAKMTYRSGGILNFLLHGDRWQSTPAGRRNLTLFSGDSPVQNAGLGGLVPYNAKFIPGYRHYDVVTAAEKQNSGMPELASSDIANFMIQGT
ncbi:hypothetical protein [Nocardia seriolae]|uniref:Uncharacterized protein n=1 Tax=Nocardia seriolae TaxID=37332 RepID=A0ABC8ASA5_9NOCA|nr:hypothetical protein [Nocardia seriolae]APA97104.1 hypothetical protein NS506_03048 [Nocardia seriolae]MTJ65106.1 hypothetical protein [Nocardia seriolae]MTJ74883.1 hypothetical protein [Nocardia seriolae]MTJ86969.1 hypothetical protein [Nocardia seriolae]MTK30965.1 hypothetical protein [Nocardia seriolae]